MAIAYVGRVGTATLATGGTSATITVGAGGVGAGDAILIAIHMSNGTTSASAIDAKGNTYALDGGPWTDGPGDSTQILSAQNITALASGDTITITMPTNSEAFVIAEEFSGLAGAKDGTVGTGASTGTAIASGILTTTNANDLLFAAVGYEAPTSGESFSVWGSYTPNGAITASTDGLVDAYQIVSATGNYNVSPTASVSTAWMCGQVAYKASGVAVAAAAPFVPGRMPLGC